VRGADSLANQCLYTFFTRELTSTNPRYPRDKKRQITLVSLSRYHHKSLTQSRNLLENRHGTGFFMSQFVPNARRDFCGFSSVVGGSWQIPAT
jgi:hypothetical protein